MSHGAPAAPLLPERRLRSHLICLGLYLLLAVAMTWPLASQLSSRVPAGDDDLWQNYWNFWWWEQALLERHQSPYHTDLLFHPEGAALGLHTHSEANQILALPINAIFGPAAALNVCLLLGFALGGFGAYLLAGEYTPRAGPAFVAGAIFAFFPQHVEQSLEHLNLASIQGIPLFLWALVRLVRRGGRAYIATGALFAFNCLLGWHNGFISVPLGAALAWFEARGSGRPRKEVLRDLAKAAFVAFLLLAPFMKPLVRDALERVGRFRKSTAPRPIDPLFLFIPHPGNPFWGRWVGAAYEKMRTYPSVGFIGYAGIVTLALSFVGVRGGPAAGAASRRRILFWSGAAIFYLLMSFGTTLVLAGREMAGVPMPYALFQHVPFFSRVRVPHRFLVPAMLCLSILAAYGADRIASRFPSRRLLAIGAVTALVLLDLLWLPYPTRSLPDPPWVHGLAALPPGLAVLNIPGGHRSRAADDMYFQTLHHRPLVGGYVSIPMRSMSNELRQYPVMRRIFQSSEHDTGYTGPSLTKAIRAVDAGIVVVHLTRTVEALRERRREAAMRHPGDPYKLLPYEPDEGMPSPLLDRMRAELRDSFGPPVFVEEGIAEIYLTAPRQLR